jgi:hypothetical protein
MKEVVTREGSMANTVHIKKVAPKKADKEKAVSANPKTGRCVPL